MSRVRPVGRPAILRGKTFNVGHYTQPFQPHFFTPVMLIGTIDFYHFIPRSRTLTLPTGHKVSAKQTSWLHFLTHFSTDQDEMYYGVEAILAEHLDTIFE